MASIVKNNGCLHQFVDVHAIGTIDADGMEFSTERRIISPAKRPHAAVFAKDVMDVIRAVINQRGVPGEQPEGVGFCDGAPHSRPGAHFTIALERACGQIDIGLETDRATVTASGVGFLHGGSQD
jgi:hypothetical protein